MHCFCFTSSYYFVLEYDVRLVSQILSIIVENAKTSTDFICRPKMAFWWGRLCPHIGTWNLLIYCRRRRFHTWQITGCSKAVQEEKEIFTEATEKVFFRKLIKLFNFLKTGMRCSSATYKTKLNHFSAIWYNPIVLSL